MAPSSAHLLGYFLKITMRGIENLLNIVLVKRTEDLESPVPFVPQNFGGYPESHLFIKQIKETQHDS